MKARGRLGCSRTPTEKVKTQMDTYLPVLLDFDKEKNAMTSRDDVLGKLNERVKTPVGLFNDEDGYYPEFLLKLFFRHYFFPYFTDK